MNILNGNEAFAAMMAGRNIMCRLAGELIEFNDLDQFPATVFVKPGYEFCIKIDEITINGFTFLKPYSLDELEEGQDIFLIGNTGSIVKGQFIPEYEELVLAVKNGSVQRDLANAELQAKAFQSLLGVKNELVIKVVDFHTYMKPSTKTKKASRKKDETPSEKVETVQHSGEMPSDSSSKEIETDPLKIVESFTSQINECVKVESVLALRYSFSANGYLDREHIHHLFNLVETKLIELDPEQYAPKTENADLSVEALKKLQQDAESLIKAEQDHIEAGDQPPLILVEPQTAQTEEKNVEVIVQHAQDEHYQKLLGELLERASIAKTPNEANALYKYTVRWTEEQRKPLMSAIHARLDELNPLVNDSSLSVRISKAMDLTELDALEIDVSASDEFIQPQLMELVNKRRAELDPFFNPLGNAS